MMNGRKKQKFVDLVEKILVRWGYTHTEGKLYGLLLFSEKPLTIEDMVKMTDLSRSSVSTALKRLSNDYFVDVKKRGRVKVFYPIPYFLETFLKQPKTLLEKEIRPLKHIAEYVVAKREDEEFNYKMKELLDNLSKLECLLEHIIDIETEVECTNR